MKQSRKQKETAIKKQIKYNRLLMNAYSTSEDVDKYDLYSGRKKSVLEWEKLLRAAYKAKKRLIEFVAKNKDVLLMKA